MLVHLDDNIKVETVVYDCYERICNKLGGPRCNCCEANSAKYRKTVKKYYSLDDDDEWVDDSDNHSDIDEEWEEQ